MGALTPIGNNLESFWADLKAGKSGGGPITRFDTTKWCQLSAKFIGFNFRHFGLQRATTKGDLDNWTK